MNSRIQKLSENPILQDKRFNVVVKIQLNIFCFNTIELDTPTNPGGFLACLQKVQKLLTEIDT